MKNNEMQNPARRKFLLAAPVAAVAGITLADIAVLPSFAQTPSPAPIPAPPTPENFKLISADELAGDIKVTQAKPGGKSLYDDKNFSMNVSTEKATTAGEFEWHEDHDHIVQILDGSTVYELGGTPQGAHSTGPGQWRAPSATGVTKVTLNRGDLLVIRRGTLHRRATAETVTLILTSPTTPPASLVPAKA